MTHTPKKKRRRTVPRDIGEKTGREIMETVFGKQAMRTIDATLKDKPKTSDSSSMKET